MSDIRQVFGVMTNFLLPPNTSLSDFICYMVSI